MTDDAPITPEEALAAIPLLLQQIAELQAEVDRLRKLVSNGYARKRPAIVDATPIRRTEDVP